MDKADPGILPRCACLNVQAQKYYDQRHPSVLKLSKVPPTEADTV